MAGSQPLYLVIEGAKECGCKAANARGDFSDTPNEFGATKDPTDASSSVTIDPSAPLPAT